MPGAGHTLDSCCVLCLWSWSRLMGKELRLRAPHLEGGLLMWAPTTPKVHMLSPVGFTEDCKLSTVISEWGSGLEVQVFQEGSREEALGWSGGEGKVCP